MFREERIKLKYTQRELGRAIGVSAMTIINWEHGKKLPTRSNIEKLLKIGFSKKVLNSLFAI